MKVALLTIQKSPSSYGANLQCYALWKYLNSIDGVHCDVIDLLRPCHKGFKESNKILSNSNLLNNTNIVNKPNFKDKIKHLILSFLGIPRTNKSFKKFYKLCNYTKRLTIDELYSKDLKYDIYISGSDQIWNPTQIYPIEPFFLTFTNKKKISYASSIGLNNVPDIALEKMVKWLSSYSYISVRENETANLLSKKINTKVTSVVDPTLLFNNIFWTSLIDSEVKSMKLPNDYILIYSLGYTEEVNQFCKHIIQKSDKKVVLLDSPFNNSIKVQNIKNKGPLEFLYLIKHASFVYTDSFHCSLFCMQFKIPFFSMVNNCNKNRLTRITDLLSLCDLDNKRIVPMEQLEDTVLDFSEWNDDNLSKAIYESKEFLKKALTGVSNE